MTVVGDVAAVVLASGVAVEVASGDGGMEARLMKTAQGIAVGIGEGNICPRQRVIR